MTEDQLYTAKEGAKDKLLSALKEYQSAAEADGLDDDGMSSDIEELCRDAGIQVDVLRA